MKALRKLLILSVSLLALLKPMELDSCGFYIMGEEYRFWLFQPNYNEQVNFRPFFYSSNTLFNAWDSDDQTVHEEAGWSQNTCDWFSYLKGAVEKKDIYSILDETDPNLFFGRGDSLKYNGFYSYIKRKNRPAWEYLCFAKQIEAVESGYSWWQCDDCPEISFPGQPVPAEYQSATDDLRQKGLDLYKKTTDRFLKERIAYQLVRISYDSGDARKIYDEFLIPVQSESWVKYAALLKIATGVNDPKSDYELSLIFDRCPDKANRCIQLFDNSKGTMALAKNNHERAVILSMDLMQEPFQALKELKKVYQLDPTNKTLPVLLVREINKLEDWILTPRLTEYRPAVYYEKHNEDDYDWYWTRHNNRITAKNFQNDLAYAKQLTAFIMQLSIEGKRTDKGFLHLCAGYLQFMCKDLKAAEQEYELASADKKLSKEARFQLELNQLCLAVSNNRKPDADLEARILSITSKLKSLPEDSYNVSKGQRDQLYLMLSKIYMDNGQMAKAIFLLGNSGGPFADFYDNYKGAYHVLLEKAKPSDYEDMIALLKKKNKTPFEQHITENVWFPLWSNDWGTNYEGWDINKLLDLKSIYYIRHDQLDSAYATVSRIEDCYWNQYPYQLFKNDDPFLVSPWNSHTSYNPQNKEYNKKSFLKELISLKKLAASSTGNKRAMYLYKIGNAYLSMTWRGKYWIMSSTFNSSAEVSKVPAWNNRKFIDSYYFNRTARRYFEASLNSTSNKELRSLSAFMASNCLRTADGYMDNRTPGMNLYLRNLPNTADVRELSKNCELFKTLMVKHYEDWS